MINDNIQTIQWAGEIGHVQVNVSLSPSANVSPLEMDNDTSTTHCSETQPTNQDQKTGSRGDAEKGIMSSRDQQGGDSSYRPDLLVTNAAIVSKGNQEKRRRRRRLME